MRRSLLEDRLDVLLRIEGQQVVHFFADSDVADREIELAGDRDYNAALGRAVELGEDDAGDTGGLGELARLLEAVLTRGGVEHEQHLVRSAGNHARGGAAHLFEL